jgi:hypothetical protein
MRKYNLNYSFILFENTNQLDASSKAKKCDTATSDRS